MSSFTGPGNVRLHQQRANYSLEGKLSCCLGVMLSKQGTLSTQNDTSSHIASKQRKDLFTREDPI